MGIGDETRGTRDDSVSGEIRRPPYCLSRTLVIPPSFEELEREVIQWMSRCVMSRTEDSRGLPVEREIELVRNFSNLSDLWSRQLEGRIGQRVEIRVRYLRDDLRVNSLIFSITSSRTGRVRDGEPTIMEFPDSSGVIGGAVSPPPDSSPGWDDALSVLEDVSDLMGEFSEGVLAALIRTLEDNYRTLAAGDQLVVWQGIVIGYADTFARMAVLMPTSLEQVAEIRTPALAPIPLIPETWPVRGEVLLDTPFFNDGYQSGYRLAIDRIRSLEELRQINPVTRQPLPYRSILLLYELRTTSGRGRRSDIYHRVRGMLPDINVLP